MKKEIKNKMEYTVANEDGFVVLETDYLPDAIKKAVEINGNIFDKYDDLVEF